MIDVALCADENYVVPCIVTITSIFENNKDESVSIYVLTDHFSNESLTLFDTLAQRYNQTIKVIQVDINTYSNLVVNNRYTKATYYRFLLPNIIKEHSRVLYLDCDIIVRGSLKSLFEIDITNYSCAVVEDAQCDDVIHKNRIKFLGNYFNAGVLLINLDYWRQNKIGDLLVSFVEKYPERCYYNDQDALNIVLENRVLYLPYTYNFQQKWYFDLNTIPFLYTKHPQVDLYRTNPLIVHFTLSIKPWFIECTHPFKAEWIKFLKISKLSYDIKCYYSRKQRIKQLILKFIPVLKKII